MRSARATPATSTRSRRITRLAWALGVFTASVQTSGPANAQDAGIATRPGATKEDLCIIPHGSPSSACGFSREDVHAGTNQLRSQLGLCAELGRGHGPSLRLVIRVDAAGHCVAQRIEQPPDLPPAAQDCLAQAVAKSQFTAKSGRRPTEMTVYLSHVFPWRDGTNL
jgi:hypothetical protein